MITVAIVEDDDGDAEALQKCFDAFSEETGNQFAIERFKDGLAFLDSPKLDYAIVVFDIAMPNINGMQAAKRLREKDRVANIIFVTNMTQYALFGYDVGAVDFIIKPLKYERFKRTLVRVAERIRHTEEKEVIIKSASRTIRLRISHIFYVEVMEHYLKFHTDTGVIENYGKLKAIEEELKDYNFARCNHCYLVNLRYITEIKDEQVCVGDDWLKISHKRKKEFLQTVAAYLASRR